VGLRDAAVPDVGADEVAARVEHASLRIDHALRLRLDEVPLRVDVPLRPLSVALEDGPAVRIPADVLGVAPPGDAAPRLRDRPVEARLAIRIVRHHEPGAVPESLRDEAELPVHVAAHPRRRAARI